MSQIYALIEPAIVGGGVLVALGFALRRFVPRLRGGAAAGGCGSGCSSCGGCGSAPAARDRSRSRSCCIDAPRVVVAAGRIDGESWIAARAGMTGRAQRAGGRCAMSTSTYCQKSCQNSGRR